MRQLSDCAIHTYSHDLARPRRTLQETQGSSRQVSKKIKQIKQIQKNERKALSTLAVTSQCRIIKIKPLYSVYRTAFLVPKVSGIRYSPLSPVRGTSKKTQKRKRAEAVDGPSPGGVWGGNGRALTGPKGPYLLPGKMLIPGFNRPVQSQAVNWATAGLLAGPRRCWPAFPAAPRRQQPQAT